jgi:hypothetical protein
MVVLAGCSTSQYQNPNVVKAPNPCHPSEVLATSVLEPQEVKKARRSFPSCPPNMRLVLPSDREIAGWYGKTSSDSRWNLEDQADVEYSHATCIPDSYGTAKGK